MKLCHCILWIQTKQIGSNCLPLKQKSLLLIAHSLEKSSLSQAAVHYFGTGWTFWIGLDYKWIRKREKNEWKSMRAVQMAKQRVEHRILNFLLFFFSLHLSFSKAFFAFHFPSAQKYSIFTQLSHPFFSRAEYNLVERTIQVCNACHTERTIFAKVKWLTTGIKSQELEMLLKKIILSNEYNKLIRAGKRTVPRNGSEQNKRNSIFDKSEQMLLFRLHNRNAHHKVKRNRKHHGWVDAHHSTLEIWIIVFVRAPNTIYICVDICPCRSIPAKKGWESLCILHYTFKLVRDKPIFSKFDSEMVHKSHRDVTNLCKLYVNTKGKEAIVIIIEWCRSDKSHKWLLIKAMQLRICCKQKTDPNHLKLLISHWIVAYSKHLSSVHLQKWFIKLVFRQ